MQFPFDLVFTSVDNPSKEFAVTAETPELTSSPDSDRYTLICGKEFFNVVDANVSRKEQLQFDISSDGLVARSIGRNAAAFFVAGASEPSVPRSRDDTFLLKRFVRLVVDSSHSFVLNACPTAAINFLC